MAVPPEAVAICATNFRTAFVGRERGDMGLSMSGINWDETFGNIRSPYYESVQFGYNFQHAGGLPLTVYAGFDTLKYKAGIGGTFAPFDTMCGTLPGYSGRRASNSSRRRMSVSHSVSATANSRGALTATSIPFRCPAPLRLSLAVAANPFFQVRVRTRRRTLASRACFLSDLRRSSSTG